MDIQTHVNRCKAIPEWLQEDIKSIERGEFTITDCLAKTNVKRNQVGMRLAKAVQDGKLTVRKAVLNGKSVNAYKAK